MFHASTRTVNTSKTSWSCTELTAKKGSRISDKSLRAQVKKTKRSSFERNCDKLQKLVSQQRHKISNCCDCEPSRRKQKSIKILNRLERLDSSLRPVHTPPKSCCCLPKKRNSSQTDRSQQFSEYHKEKISLWEAEKKKLRKSILQDGKFRIVNGWIEPVFSKSYSANSPPKDISFNRTSLETFVKRKNNSRSCPNSMDNGAFSLWNSSQQKKTRESIVQDGKFRIVDGWIEPAFSKSSFTYFTSTDISLDLTPMEIFVKRKNRSRSSGDSMDNGAFSLWISRAA